MAKSIAFAAAASRLASLLLSYIPAGCRLRRALPRRLDRDHRLSHSRPLVYRRSLAGSGHERQGRRNRRENPAKPELRREDRCPPLDCCSVAGGEARCPAATSLRRVMVSSERSDPSVWGRSRGIDSEPPRFCRILLIRGARSGLRPEHLFGADEAAEVLRRDQAQGFGRLAQGEPLLVSLFGDLCGVVVADVRVERGDEHQ